MTSFVQLLADKPLEILVDSSFYLSYHVGIQPSEIDKLSTYEFDRYLILLEEQLKNKNDYELALAQNYGIGGLLAK